MNEIVRVSDDRALTKPSGSEMLATRILNKKKKKQAAVYRSHMINLVSTFDISKGELACIDPEELRYIIENDLELEKQNIMKDFGLMAMLGPVPLIFGALLFFLTSFSGGLIPILLHIAGIGGMIFGGSISFTAVGHLISKSVDFIQLRKALIFLNYDEKLLALKEVEEDEDAE